MISYHFPRRAQFGSLQVGILILMVAGFLPQANEASSTETRMKELSIPSGTIDWQASAGFFTRIVTKRVCPLITVASNRVFLTTLNSGRQYVLWEILEDRPCELLKIDGFNPEAGLLCSWPQVFVQNGGVKVANVRRGEAGAPAMRLCVSELQLDSKGLKEKFSLPLTPPKSKSSKPDCTVEALLPVDPSKNSFLFLGSFEETYFFYGPLPEPDPPSFSKNCTRLASEDYCKPLERVAPKGRFYVAGATYACEGPSIFHCAWRREHSRVYYSHSRAGEAWSRPIQVFPKRGDAPNTVMDVAIASNADATHLLWVVDKTGIFSAQIKEQVPSPAARIGDWEGSDSLLAEGITRMSEAPCSDIAVDEKGTVYAIWALNRNLLPRTSGSLGKHRIYLAIKRGGEWERTVILADGDGFVRSPSIVVDARGNLHVAYLKEVSYSKFGCFYSEISFKDLHKQLK